MHLHPLRSKQRRFNFICILSTAQLLLSLLFLLSIQVSSSFRVAKHQAVEVVVVVAEVSLHASYKEPSQGKKRGNLLAGSLSAFPDCRIAQQCKIMNI